MPYIVGEPLQIPSDATHLIVESRGSGTLPSVTHTYTLPALTKQGSTGTVTIVNGKVTSYTKPS